MSQREDIVAVAAKEIGYKEYQNNNNKYGVWYGIDVYKRQAYRAKTEGVRIKCQY